VGHQSRLGWAILLDLDQTLVITSPIEYLREARQWTRAYHLFRLTEVPVGTRDFLERARAIAKLGVVTSSPRKYAEKLLAYHNLPVEVLVAYHDVKYHKPHPEPIMVAAECLQAMPERCFYIGDKVEDLECAIAAGSIPIGITWDGSLHSLPGTDAGVAICSNWEDVMTVIEGLTSTSGE
jgi:HAD superfamily hydrolase (TIGR01549 family)